jgi:hypothetical protein
VNCLERLPVSPETYGSKRKGRTAAHIACAKGWLDGIRWLIRHSVPFDSFDQFRRTPLAYVADTEDVAAFHHIIDYFTGTRNTFGLNNVFLSPQTASSVDFLNYSTTTHNTVMVNCCQRAHELGSSTVSRWIAHVMNGFAFTPGWRCRTSCARSCD